MLHEKADPNALDVRVDTRGAALPWWQPWLALALFTFLVNFIWEMVQVPFYLGHASGSYFRMVEGCAQATLGDVGIALAAYAVVALARGRRWLASPRAGSIVAFIALGMAVTAIIERVSVDVFARWSYAAFMPTIAGVGVVPLLQWLTLPPLVLWLARRHLAGPLTSRQDGSARAGEA